MAGPMVDAGFTADMLPEGMEVPVDAPMEFPGGAEVIEDADGGVTVQALDGELVGDNPQEDLPHEANLAEFLEDGVLGELSNELIGFYEDDLESRKAWEETYVKGLDLLGLNIEERTTPFAGASSVTHPLISESITQFQAQAYKELLPSAGPVKTSIIGAKTPERESQAARVKDYMNYMLTEVMEEYDPGVDQMLFYLPLSGSTFKKVYYDPIKGRPTSEFIAAQDLVVPYSAVDLSTTPRVTHVLKMSGNDVLKMQMSGIYKEVDLADTDSGGESNEVQDKLDKLEGRSKTFSDDTRTLLEFHVDLEIEGFEELDEEGEPTGLKVPYVVTLDKDSGKILSIQKNFDPTDPSMRKRQYFVHYKFMPGLGFYGFGLIHMIGGLGRAVTSILRQLIDAGTLANLPAGFKARGIRVRDADTPLQPGEFRDIDAPGGDLRNAIIPLPYKEPSATLAQLLGVLVDAGRRFVSLADQQMMTANGEAPVGTTIALMERGMKVMSAIHKRLHYAQKSEFRLLAKVMAENLPQQYPYEVVGAQANIMQADFDARIDVIPVSDPNIFSMAQRVTLAQTQLQLAQSNPQIHNLHAAYRRMYSALEVSNIDEILPPPPQPQPMDPAMENAAIIQMQPPQVFPQQDHDAHISAHIAMTQMAVIAANPMAIGAISAHVFQHASFKAQQMVQQEMMQEAQAMQQQQLQQMQQQMGAQVGTMAQNGQIPIEQMIPQIQQNMAGIQAPPMTPPDPAEVEKRIAQKTAEIIAELAPQLSPAPDQGQDPLVKIRMQELAIKDNDTKVRQAESQDKLELERQKLMQRTMTDQDRIKVQEDIADGRVQVSRERIAAQMMMNRNRE